MKSSIRGSLSESCLSAIFFSRKTTLVSPDLREKYSTNYQRVEDPRKIGKQL